MNKKSFYQRDLTTGDIYLHYSLLGNCERITQTKGKELHIEQTKQSLLEYVKSGDTIYTSILSVSSSGMSRRISCYIVVDGKIRNIDRWTSIVTQWKHSDNGGIVVGGSGMDMAFHLVYTLSSILFNDGYVLNKESI